MPWNIRRTTQGEWKRTRELVCYSGVHTNWDYIGFFQEFYRALYLVV